ncbi:MAG: UvrD-helicase domain-containing protein [Pseudomonadota bacterium]|nr:UvrD-helicase domain-containing protein [Pseudomonadota bacterium]
MHKACDPYESFIVEASAGTGKTHLLIHRYLALVAAHAPLAEIITVTFTVKAAHEMQERIIALANDLLHSQDKQTDFNSALTKFHQQAQFTVQEPKNAEAVAREVLSQSQRMKVKTMDSLWQEWLTLLASYDLQQEIKHPITILDAEEIEDIREKAWDKLWQQLKTEKLGAEVLQDNTITNVRERVESLHEYRQTYRYVEHSEHSDDAQAREAYHYLNRKGRGFAVIAERLEKLYAKHKRSKYEFNDLLNAMHRVINHNPEAQYVLEQRVAHILLDEFQDTNDQQWEVFKPLCLELMSGDNLTHSRRGIRSTVFIVGDKKQSIYTFRGTNPKIMTTAARDLSGLQPQHLALQGNYRSAPHLIAFFNQAFPKLQLADYQTHTAEQTDQPSVINVAMHEQSDKKQSKDELVRLEADYVANKIQALLHTKELREQDICILYRNHTHADKFAEALTSKGIKHCKHDDIHLLEHQEVKDMVALCRWLLFAEDLQALLTVLRSQGVSEEEVLALAADTTAQSMRSTLILAQLKDKRLAANLQLLQQQSHLPAYRLIAEAIYRCNFIAAYSQEHAKFNIVYFLETLTSLASKGISSLAMVCAKLDKNFATDSYKANDAVSLMTMHKAKGLEFPCVFLVQVGDDWTKTDSYWLRQTETIKYIGTGNDPACKRPAALTAQIKASKQHRTAHEELRLLYVAMTRAKNYLMLSGADKHFLANIHSAITAQKDTAFSKEHTPDPTVANPAPNFVVMASKSAPDTSTLNTSVAHDTELDHDRPTPLPASSPASRPDVKLFRASAKPAKPLQDKSLLHTLRGVYAHKMLERAANAKPYTDSSYWQALLNSAAVIGISDDTRQKTDNAIAAFINSSQWQDLFANALWFKTEVRISTLNADELLNGIIDLLVCYPANKMLVVDYKLGDIKDSYTEQLKRYAAAIKCIYPDRQVKTKVISI